jgi:transposase
MVPVDIDVTPMDISKTSKQGASRTYMGFDGYAPMMTSHITSQARQLITGLGKSNV